MFHVGDKVRFNPVMLAQTVTFYVTNLQPGKFKLAGHVGGIIADDEGVFSVRLETGEIVLGVRPESLEAV